MSGYYTQIDETKIADVAAYYATLEGFLQDVAQWQARDSQTADACRFVLREVARGALLKEVIVHTNLSSRQFDDRFRRDSPLRHLYEDAQELRKWSHGKPCAFNMPPPEYKDWRATPAAERIFAHQAAWLDRWFDEHSTFIAASKLMHAEAQS